MVSAMATKYFTIFNIVDLLKQLIKNESTALNTNSSDYMTNFHLYV
jgi:hypothetical protein